MKNYYYDICCDCEHLDHCFRDWKIAGKISNKTISEKDGYYLDSGSCNSYYPDPYISTFYD